MVVSAVADEIDGGWHDEVFALPNVRAKATEEADADRPRKDDTHGAWSGQAVAAVAGRRLERGVRPRYFFAGMKIGTIAPSPLLFLETGARTSWLTGACVFASMIQKSQYELPPIGETSDEWRSSYERPSTAENSKSARARKIPRLNCAPMRRFPLSIRIGLSQRSLPPLMTFTSTEATKAIKSAANHVGSRLPIIKGEFSAVGP